MEEYVTNLHKNDPNFVYDITLNFFAYFSTTSAPVTYDAATNTYAPIDNTVICGPHVAPWYAPIFMDYTYSIFHESNLTYLSNFYGWDAISETIHLWPYETCFKSYMSPYDSFNGMQDLFQVMADINTDFIFNQSQWNNGSATAWHMLKAYLTAKLAWDSSQDMDKLIDRYFAAMYGPAADTMREWFNSTRAYCAMLHSKGLYQGSFSVYYQATSSDLWSYSILRKWLEYADKAMSEIEKFKDVDPELYASYYKHIAIERISPSYLIIQLYESRLNVSEAKMILDRTVEDSILCGATKTGEGSGTIANWAESIDLTD
jgi:hypothetical protein